MTNEREIFTEYRALRRRVAVELVLMMTALGLLGYYSGHWLGYW